MDLNENVIKSEVNNLVNVLKNFLPLRKEPLQILNFHTEEVPRLSAIHAETKRVFPKCFFGAKVIVMREIMDRVKVMQEYSYGKQLDEYKCFNEILDRENEPKTDHKVLLESTGSITANYSETTDEGYEITLTSKIKDLVSSETQVSLSKATDKYSSSFIGTMKDVDPHNFQLTTQWMYKISPELYFGSEVAIKPMTYPPIPKYSLSARYERPTYVVSSTVSKSSFQVCLFKEFAPDLKLGTMISDGSRNGETTFSLAVNKSYGRGSDLKIFVDSQRCGGFTFEKEVYFREHNGDRVLRMVASALINRQRFVRFGFGFNLDF